MNWTLLAGSLAAVLALAAIAWLLRLGGGAIDGPEAAREQAEALLSGFEAGEAVVASDGRAALVRGHDGSVALLKLHGAHVAARRLQPPVSAVHAAEGLAVDSGERRFGRVVLKGVSALP